MPITSRPFVRSARIAVPALAAATAIVAGAAGAGALPGQLRVVSTSPTNAAAVKVQTTGCPAGTTSIGVGAAVNAALSGHVGLTALGATPATATTRSAASRVVGGAAINWSLTTAAICAARAPLAGLQLVTASTPVNSVNLKTVTVACPLGKRLISSGASIAGPAGAVMLTAAFPIGNATMARAAEINAGTPANWTLTASAVCVNAAVVPGLIDVVAASPVASPASATVTAMCPAGRRVVGTGIDTSLPTGAVLIEDLMPRPALDGVTARVVEKVPGTPAGWSARVHALCAF